MLPEALQSGSHGFSFIDAAVTGRYKTWPLVSRKGLPVKALLSLTLIGVQLLCWGSSPIYLCLGCERAACVHAADAPCHCCAGHGCSTAQCRAEPLCCPCHAHNEEEDARTWREGHLAPPPRHCECTHILIALPGQPTVTLSAVSLADDDQWTFDAGLWAAVGLSRTLIQAECDVCQALRDSLPAGPSTCLATVMLRC
jgi:hypothetical protein